MQRGCGSGDHGALQLAEGDGVCARGQGGTCGQVREGARPNTC